MPRLRRRTPLDHPITLAIEVVERENDMKNQDFPTMSELLRTGAIWIEDESEYVGKADDGTIVALGAVGFEESAERYLVANPNPSDW